MLVYSLPLLLEAEKKGKAIAAFNIENMEMAMAVISAASGVNTPVILQTTSTTLKYAAPLTFAGIADSLTRDFDAAMHLDHGNSLEIVKKCINSGYTSIMYDGSLFDFEENINITKQVVALAENIPVEAELGSVGGKEDDHEGVDTYTDPNQAKEFVKRTGINSLAIAIGTAHGIYKNTPMLDINRLKEIRNIVDIPLVLHGASGLSKEAIRECIKQGISKVNFATELRIAYSNGVKSYLKENPDAFDPKAYGKAGMDEVKKTVLEKLEIVS